MLAHRWRCRRRPLGLSIVVLAAAALLAACGNEDAGGGSPEANQAAAASPVKVVATTTQLGDIVRRIGGAGADVTQILRPNTDPHDYEPRPSDVAATAAARVVFQSGNNLDAWATQIVEQAGGHQRTVVLADSNVDRVAGEARGPEASRYDPHWWHDPTNVEAAIPVIRDALARANPDAKALFDRNAAAYLARVRTLDAGIRRCFDQVPRADRKLVTDHDAFNYFARRYAITVIGAVIPSQTTRAQASAGEVAALVKTIRREHVKAVFPETSVNAKLAKAIARASGASADYTLYGDTLGPKGSPGATYLSMERANADAMMRGFTGGARNCTITGL
jgi:ABC-type Zn uptake system ZnuABC Zn-binding protein ZnuA